MDLALVKTQRPIVRMVLAQAGLSQPGPALWRIVGVRELAQLDLEEMPIQRSAHTAADAEEVVRYPLAQFCIVGHPGPKLSGVRAQCHLAKVDQAVSESGRRLTSLMVGGPSWRVPWSPGLFTR
jgi:hypothetical protein